MNEPRLITVTFPADCLTCEEAVEAGSKAHWQKGVGMWHEDCAPPTNLKVYAKEAATSQRLGF